MITAPENTVISSVIPQADKVKPNNENTVLLQTAKAWVSGPVGGRIMCCLLDGGSQGSFVHENVAKTLKLPVIIFGSPAPTTVKHNPVKLCLENFWNKVQSIEREAVVTPQLCTAVMQVPGDHIQN